MLPEDEAHLAAELTEILRTPSGEQRLRGVQARALIEIAEHGGAFVPVRVAGGKTLISLLAPRVLPERAARPLLLVPAALEEKTRRAHRALSVHWQIPGFYRILTYQRLGQRDGAKILGQFAPTMIVADEAHYLKNTRAGVTKVVGAWMRHAPSTAFVALTGTVSKRSILDFAHVAQWALRLGTPVPVDFHAVRSWANVLDERRRKDDEDEPEVGALEALMDPAELEAKDVNAARSAFRRRFVSCPGIVTAAEPPVDLPVIVEALSPEVPAEIRHAQQRIRDTWETPDGEIFEEAVALWRHNRELARGFCYVWDPPPPLEWKIARRAYRKAVQEILRENRRGLHVPSAVVDAIREGHYPHAVGALAEWERIRDSFVPRTRAVWLSDYAVRAVADHLAREPAPALVWVEHRELGEALATATGAPFYSREARDRRGRSIMDHHRGHAIASIHSVKEGFDLQRQFSRLVYVAAPTTAVAVEQTIGRVRREGQPADEIRARWFLACPEDWIALDGALKDAQFTASTLGQDQAILSADFAFPLPSQS
jgi:hypothetical protein